MPKTQQTQQLPSHEPIQNRHNARSQQQSRPPTRTKASPYQRRSLDQIDTKVIEHVREYGFITNRTIQRTFDMHVYAARDLLTDLRRREILEKEGAGARWTRR